MRQSRETWVRLPMRVAVAVAVAFKVTCTLAHSPFQSPSRISSFSSAAVHFPEHSRLPTSWVFLASPHNAANLIPAAQLGSLGGTAQQHLRAASTSPFQPLYCRKPSRSARRVNPPPPALLLWSRLLPSASCTPNRCCSSRPASLHFLLHYRPPANIQLFDHSMIP